MSDKCPKCGQPLKTFYFKQNCPKCGVNLMYYKLDERLEADVENAEKEVRELWLFIRKLDKARVIEKYCKKHDKPLPWEQEELNSGE